MTTLSNKLNDKIEQASIQSLWDEIQTLFLQLSCRKLREGVTVRIFQNTDDSPLCYIIGNGSTGTAFSGKYDLDTFRKVIPICEKEGLKVREVNRGTYDVTFIPSRK